jgi:hypothetical protein
MADEGSKTAPSGKSCATMKIRHFERRVEHR